MIDFTSLLKLRNINQNNIKKLKKIFSKFKLTYNNFILTKPDDSFSKDLESFFSEINNYFENKAQYTNYIIFICSGQDSEIFHIDNFNNQHFLENFKLLVYKEQSLIQNAKGNQPFGIYIYCLEFSFAPTHGGFYNVELKAA